MHGYEKPLLPREAVGRVRELESALNRSQAALAQAEQRAALAEKAAQDAWAFVRAVMPGPSKRP
jgi:hypothetical protein